MHSFSEHCFDPFIHLKGCSLVYIIVGGVAVSVVRIIRVRYRVALGFNFPILRIILAIFIFIFIFILASSSSLSLSPALRDTSSIDFCAMLEKHLGNFPIPPIVSKYSTTSS